ncbi:hypothetical protein ACJX0J_021313, partial [Zea mays]
MCVLVRFYASERYKAKLNPFGFYRLDFFYHEYINKKTLFFASNINQFDLILNASGLYFLLFNKIIERLIETACLVYGFVQFIVFILFSFVYKCFRNLLDNLILYIHIISAKGFKNVIISYLLTIAILDLSNMCDIL